MKRKSILTASIVAVFLFSVVPLRGDDGDPWGRNKGGGIGSSIPTRQRITSQYSDGVLKISFAISEGLCILTIHDIEKNETSQYAVDSTTGHSEVYIGDIYKAELSLTTPSGAIYTSSIE